MILPPAAAQGKQARPAGVNAAAPASVTSDQPRMVSNGPAGRVEIRFVHPRATAMALAEAMLACLTERPMAANELAAVAPPARPRRDPAR